MSERIPGPDVMTAMANAIDDGASDYRMTIFYLGVGVGQCFSRGWDRKELDQELSNLARGYPKLAARIQEALAAIPAVVGGSGTP